MGLGHRLAQASEPAGGAVADEQRGNQHEQEQSRWGDGGEHQRILVPVEEVDRGEHDRAEDQQRHDVEEGLTDHRAQDHGEVLDRAAGPSRHHQGAAGSPNRAGRVDDISTPIIVPCRASLSRIRERGSAALRIACQEKARITMAAHIAASAEKHEGRAGVDQGVGDAADPDLGQSQVGQVHAAQQQHHHPDAADIGERAFALGAGQGSLQAGQTPGALARLEVGRLHTQANGGALRRPFDPGTAIASV